MACFKQVKQVKQAKSPGDLLQRRAPLRRIYTMYMDYMYKEYIGIR